MVKRRKILRGGTGDAEGPLTEAEWAIMRVVWEHEPCAAGTVQEELEKTKGWAYSTVKTTMDRMVKKGLLGRKLIRNLQLFTSRISETDAKRGEFRKMLKRAFEGALTPMMEFLLENEPISDEALKELRALVNKRTRGRGTKS
jgi:BlaI family penicillinase repressor